MRVRCTPPQAQARATLPAITGEREKTTAGAGATDSSTGTGEETTAGTREMYSTTGA